MGCPETDNKINSRVMNLPAIAHRIHKAFFSAEVKKLREERHTLVGILKSEAFAQLPIQQKIISLAELISRSRQQYGDVPRELEVALLRFNNDLQHQIVKGF
jgi:hypothetical protein